MENETPRSYKVPNTDECLSSDEAAQALREVYADCAADTKHPHNNPTHFLNKDFQAAITRLHEIKCGPEPEPQTNEAGQEVVNQWPQEHLEAMAGANNALAEKQAALVVEGNTLVDDMVANHNFERKEVPADVKPWQIRGWRLQKSLAEKDYSAVASGLQTELRQLNADAETIAGVNGAMAAPLPDDLRQQFFRGIIDDVLKVHRRRAEQPSKQFGVQLHNFPKAKE